MTTPTGQSQRPYINAMTASFVTYISLTDIIPTGVRNAAVAAVATSALAVPESQQLNMRLVTSFVGGAGLAWRLLPDNTSVKSLAVSTLFAGSTLFLGQHILEQQFVASPPVQNQPQPTENQTQSTLYILNSLATALQLIFAQKPATQSLPSSIQPLPNAGTQPVAVTATTQQQPEQVGNRAG